MFLRKYTRFVVFTVSILIATLISEALIVWLASESDYKTIAIRMMVVVLIYVPLMNFLDAYIKKSAQQYANQSKKFGKSRLLGLTIGFIVILLILFCLFALVLADKNAIADFGAWLSSIF